MITDYYREKWPVYDPTMPSVSPMMPVYYVAPPIAVTPEQWLEYQELKRRMERYDRDTGQPDCVKPEVAAWEAKVAEIVRGSMGVQS
jgi:hypothetical protein